MSTEDLKSLAKKYLGIPYRHGGRDLTGLDCLGLVHLFYQDCGINIPDGDGEVYTESWIYEDPDRYLRGVRKLGREIPLSHLQPLDFVYFKIGQYISHGAVMIDSDRFIHVLQNQPVHITRLNFKWRRRLVGARRLLP